MVLLFLAAYAAATPVLAQEKKVAQTNGVDNMDDFLSQITDAKGKAPDPAKVKAAFNAYLDKLKLADQSAKRPKRKSRFLENDSFLTESFERFEAQVRLQFPEGTGNRTARGANRRGHATEDTHRQGEDNADSKQ